MDQVKKFSTYDELLNKLRDRGCIINNASACIEVLKNIGYYRLSAYFYPFMQEDKTFVEKLSFDKVYRIYEFDRKLRNLLLTALEVIEISLELQREIAKVFKVTERTVQSAMRFETKSPTARILRAYALNHGAEQYEVTTIKKKVENPYKETITF